MAGRRRWRWPAIRQAPCGALPDVVVPNFHRRYTGVSATVQALIPYQRERISVGLWDWGGLPLAAQFCWFDLWRHGWTKPAHGGKRIWHARRDLEIVVGLLLREVLRQPWRVVFTSAAPKPPGLWLRWLMGHCDALIATSERSAAFLPGPSTVIHHGVDTAFYCPQALEGQPGELSGKLATTRRWIGAFGRIRFSKGSDLLVEALVQVLPDYPDVSAFFTGLCKPRDQAYFEAMVAKIRAAGLEERICFLGDLDRNQVRALFQQASLCVAASRREGFGLTPLEAMASGTAVLTSGAGVWPQVVDPAVGLRFETNQLEDLVAKLRLLLADPGRLQAMGEAGRQRAVARHSLAREVEAIHQLYGQVAPFATLQKHPSGASLGREC